MGDNLTIIIDQFLYFLFHFRSSVIYVSTPELLASLQYTYYTITHSGPAIIDFYRQGQGNRKDEEHLCRSNSTTNIEVKVEDSM